MTRILIIENDAALLEELKNSLEFEGYEVMTSMDGEHGVMQAVRNRPDAVILDLVLPTLSGFEVCQSLRGRGLETPILVLTARHEESDKIRALELGADDYVTRPFSIHELLARLRAMIRRSTRVFRSTGDYRFGDIKVDLLRQRVRKGRTDLTLSSLEFEVLRYLISHQGQIIPREHLLDEIWGYQAFRTTRAVDNLVGRLRQKLEARPHQPRHILTVYGIGYKFVQ